MNLITKFAYNALTKTIQAIAPGGSKSLQLTDYEEGTFTPTFKGSTSGATEATYTAREGIYKRIGRCVFFQLAMDISSAAGLTGDTNIGGFPYPNRLVPGNYEMPFPMFANTVTFTGMAVASMPQSVSHLRLYSFASAGTPAVLTVANTGTGYFTIAGHYFID